MKNVGLIILGAVAGIAIYHFVPKMFKKGAPKDTAKLTPTNEPPLKGTTEN